MSKRRKRTAEQAPLFQQPNLIAAEVDRCMPIAAKCARDAKAAAVADLEADEAAEAATYAPPAPIAPGDVVRFTRKALRSMYGKNSLGFANHAPDQQWTVVACDCGLCSSGRFVAVDETCPHYGPRHMALAGIERVPLALRRSSVACEPDAAFVEAEWAQLGIDRVRGLVRRPCP